MAEYHNQSKLRFWCQMVLPLVYDDSLSYMELLNKVVSYLNNCIQDVGNCETNIESLLEAFVNLQDYVNEIAEDISPLIEEKIDEMIESGELGEILADALASVVSPEYDSSESYVPLNYAIKDGQLYCCTAYTTGEWDSTKWRETTVGDELNTLMQKVYSLNAGDVSFDPTETYASGTVGNKLKNLTANDVKYNSSQTYNNATVGKELSNLNGAITSIPASRIRGKQVAIYGDSWAASYHGSLGADYITSYTGKTVHVGADPGGTLAHIYANVWDSYNADIYVIIGGLNDLGANTTLTAFQTTIYQFVNAIRAVNANAEIYFVTPPRMRTTTIHNYLYPLEAYRTVIFRRAADCQYNVINSLKWTDIAFENDNTHPVLADAPKIGKHIVDAIINYGDEETHLNDYSTVYGLLPNNVKLRCDNGALSFEFAALSVTLSSNLQYALVFPVANMGNDLLPFSFAVMAGDVEPIYVYHSGTANQIMIARKGAVTGDTLYISGAVFPIGMRATIFE